MNIVIMDSARLAPGVDFPPLEAERYGWLQYPQLQGGEIAATCWRSDVVVSLGTVLEADKLEQCKRLELLVLGAAADRLVDRALLRGRDIELEEVSDVDWSDAAAAAAGCKRIVAAIDAYIRRGVAQRS